MKYQALYRKYRPTRFEDVVGQEIVVKTLKNSLKNGKISHAYMFSGPRGTGKTSIAKLFAKTVNCLNLIDGDSCNSCSNCLSILNNECTDIIEIDAASNNGVDEIREIKNKITLVPNELKYKIYIIDEVHMLSIGAFNALLKTLEEPPSHVIFILATTDPHKVPVTIISRCQCFEFKRIDNISIVQRLKKICEMESISIEDDVLERIAVYSDGGLRDAIGLLDKLVSYNSEKITMSDLDNICGLLSYDYQEQFLNMIFAKESLKIIENIEKIYDQGKDLVVFCLELMELVKKKLIKLLQNDEKDLMVSEYLELLSALNDINSKLKQTDNLKIVFEVGIISFINNKNVIKNISREIISDKEVVKNDSIGTDNDNAFMIKNTKTELKSDSLIKKDNFYNDFEKYQRLKKIYVNNTFVSASKDKKMVVLSKWKELNEFVLDTEFGAAACYLVDSMVEVVGDENIILSVKYGSSIERIVECMPKINRLLEKIYSKTYKLAFLTEEEWNFEKKEYISNKNTKKYEYIEENSELDVNKDTVTVDEKETISKSDSILKKNDNNNSDIVSEAIDLFGETIVEIKE